MLVARFSIIITCYNQREFIKDAVDSALSVCGADEQIIVVDDGSTDGSQQMLSEYHNAIHFVAMETNIGKGQARNRGASLATGDYLVFLDGDDAFLPWALEVYGRVVQSKRPKLILCRMSWFNGALPPISLAGSPHVVEIVEYEDYLRKDRPFGVSASSVVCERRSFQSVQGWSQDRAFMEDQDLLFRLGDSGRAIQVVSPPTILHRSHAGQAVRQVPPFIDALYRMIRDERLGRYPGGRRRRFERSALFGGLVFFWAKRSVRARLYWDAAKLIARGWPMVVAAILRKLSVVVKGRRLAETIDL
jgi:glycosyltransferase involved in cell wall biosynthesis